MNPDYRLYHPKWYRRRMPIFWWLRKLAYVRFISRELTSVFVGYAAVLITVQIWYVARGEAAYLRFGSWLGSPVVIAFHVIVLLAVLFHTVTWLALAPKALVVRVGHKRLPDGIVLAAHYVAGVVTTGVVLWFLMGTR